MNVSGGGLESYLQHSARLPVSSDPTLQSPISASSPATNLSYDRPTIQGEILLEEIPTPYISGASDTSVNGKLKESLLRASGTSPLQRRRWRLIPATCTCPVHTTGSPIASDLGLNSSFSSNDESEFHSNSRYFSRSKVDDELERLKGSVHALESDVLQGRLSKRSGVKSTSTTPIREGADVYRTSTYQTRTEIETTRTDPDRFRSSVNEQTESLRKRLEQEVFTRSTREQELLSKSLLCDRLQRQLDDAVDRLNLAEDRIKDLNFSKKKAKDQLRDLMENDIEARTSEEEMKRVLEREISVRAKVETELHTLQKLVEREMGESVDAKRTLEAKTKELEDARAAKARLEHELHTLRSSLEHERLRLSNAAEQKEVDIEQLRDQLTIVSNQLERERDQSKKQLEDKVQELTRIQQEMQRVRKRISELESTLDTSGPAQRHLEAENAQLKAKLQDLQANADRLETEVVQLKARLQHSERERERLVDMIRDLQSQIEKLQLAAVTSSATNEQERDRQTRALRDLQGQLEDARAQHNADRERLTRTAREAQSQLDHLRAQSTEAQLQERERGARNLRELQAQLDDARAQQGIERERANISEQERERLSRSLRELQLQVEDVRTQCAHERDRADKLLGEVEETNTALDEVRLALEREIELRKESEQENQALKHLFEEEVAQWKAKEAEWEAERQELKETGAATYEQSARIAALEQEVERASALEDRRDREIEERDTLIEELQQRVVESEKDADARNAGDRSQFEDRMKAQVEKYQEQVRNLCIQLEDSTQRLEREAKARAEAEGSKKRLEKALLELNARFESSKAPSPAFDAQVAHLRNQLEEGAKVRLELEEELERTRAAPREDEIELNEVLSDDEFAIESDERVRVKLCDVQRLQNKVTKLRNVIDQLQAQQHQPPQDHEEPTLNGHGDGDEDGDSSARSSQEEEEEQEAHALNLGADLALEAEPHEHQRPPRSPLKASTPPPTRSTPISNTPPRPASAISNDAERERLENEWKRRVAQSANKYTHTRIPLRNRPLTGPPGATRKRVGEVGDTSVVQRLANDNVALKEKIEDLRKLIEKTPSEQPKATPNQAPGFYYVPVKSDEIDEELSKVVGETEPTKLKEIPSNFSRLDKGIYQFGLKKIHMQIKNGALVVRVGGGFMLFVDYLGKYGKLETIKFQRDEARRHILDPLKKEDVPRELPKHADSIQVGTLVRRGRELKLVQHGHEADQIPTTAAAATATATPPSSSVTPR